MQQTLVDNRYSILHLLGSGGMGHVYLARDEVLGRDVALKMLKEPYTDDEEFVERFRREAKNVAALSHPNIVSIYDGGKAEDGTPYIAMEYMAGGTLGELIAREGTLDVPKAAAIAIEIARALVEAHRRGVIHRDVNPHNVFLTRSLASPGATPEGLTLGTVKVGDFGIAQAAEASTMTESDLILGTPRYLSPEQAKGEPVSPKSDLYSLGVVLYKMLTGRVPFDAKDSIAIVMKHVSEQPPAPREVNPGVPEDMNTLVLQLLSKDPANRHEDAAELIRDLRRTQAGLPPALLPTKPAEVPAGRGKAKGAPTIPEDQIEKTYTPSAAVVYDRGEKRRRISPWLLAAVASVAILAILLGSVGRNLLSQDYAAQASTISLQDAVQEPVDAPRETSEETEPVTGKSDSVDEKGAEVRSTDGSFQGKASSYNVSPGGVVEQSSGPEQAVANPPVLVSQGGTTAPETAEPVALQAPPESSTPETNLETLTPEKDLKTPTPETNLETLTPEKDLKTPRPKADLETPSSREPSRGIVATVKSEQVTRSEEPTTKKVKSKRKEQEKNKK
jgi:eukaryotic-like serine/threonine-protein kinase